MIAGGWGEQVVNIVEAPATGRFIVESEGGNRRGTGPALLPDCSLDVSLGQAFAQTHVHGQYLLAAVGIGKSSVLGIAYIYAARQ